MEITDLAIMLRNLYIRGFKMMREKGKKLIGCIVFICLFIMIFVKTTYLFSNSGNDRLHIVGIKEEKPLDMVYIGGSAAFVYWQTMKAWNDYGIASYSYATNSITAENIKYYMKEVLKTQNPELFVIDVRPFQYWGEYIDEGGTRNGTDSMDLSVNRMKLVYDTLKTRELSEDMEPLSYYFSIMKYHSNYKNVLSNAASWSLINNEGISHYKGWEFINDHCILKEPKAFHTNIRAELPKECLNILYDLLDFCQSENLNPLFVVCPYYMTADQKEKFNVCQDIIESYGFAFLDANEHYDEMNMDFTTDFYNTNHVNCLGAEKYTEFLSGYIKENYDLNDHRGESAYGQWDELYDEFVLDEDYIKKSINSFIKSKFEAIEIAEKMAEEEDAGSWSLYAGNENFVMLFAMQGDWKKKDLMYKEFLKEWSINTSGESKNYIKAVSQVYNVLLEQFSDSPQKSSCIIGKAGTETGTSEVEISSDTEASIVINGKEYAVQKEGVNIVVYDFNRNQVIDSVVIDCDDRGMTLER